MTSLACEHGEARVPADRASCWLISRFASALRALAGALWVRRIAVAKGVAVDDYGGLCGLGGRFEPPIRLAGGLFNLR